MFLPNDSSSFTEIVPPQLSYPSTRVKSLTLLSLFQVRCDGAQPCLRCQKSKTECVFVKVTPKRGPPKQYVETLEPRLRDLEQVLRALQLDTEPYDASLVLQRDSNEMTYASDYLQGSIFIILLLLALT